MDRRTAEYCEMVVRCWQSATPMDFLQLSLAIVIAGWFYSRMNSTMSSR